MFFLAKINQNKNKSKEEKDKAYKDLIPRLKNDKWYIFFLSHKPKFLKKKRRS